MESDITNSIDNILEENRVFAPSDEFSSQSSIQKLEQLDFKEKCNNELIIEAVMFIQSGGNPRLMPDVLMGYVAPKKRAAVKTE